MSTGTERPGLFGMIGRFFSFKWLRWAMFWKRKGDAQFTTSAQGISDAFDIEKDKMVVQYRDLQGAVAQLETVLEELRQQLQALNTEEADLITKRAGTLAAAERAQTAGDNDGLAKHQAAFDRYDARIQEIEDEQAALEAQITENSGSMTGYFASLTKLQSEVKGLDGEKAKAVAQYVSNQKIIELNERLNGLQTSTESGPLDAVRKMNKELTAKARVSQKLAGTDVNQQDAAYEAAGRQATSSNRMAEMLAARKAEKEAKTGAATAPKVEEERPKV